MRAVTDGRPQPLNFSSDCDDYPKSILDLKSGDLKESFEREKLELEKWAECASPGYDSKAYIAKREFREKELVMLRDWIDSVLTWHKKNPKRRPTKND